MNSIQRHSVLLSDNIILPRNIIIILISNLDFILYNATKLQKNLHTSTNTPSYISETTARLLTLNHPAA